MPPHTLLEEKTTLTRCDKPHMATEDRYSRQNSLKRPNSENDIKVCTPLFTIQIGIYKHPCN